MMMDDIFFEDPAECAECHKIIESGLAVWVNGKCLCPDCYAKEQEQAS